MSKEVAQKSSARFGRMTQAVSSMLDEQTLLPLLLLRTILLCAALISAVMRSIDTHDWDISLVLSVAATISHILVMIENKSGIGRGVQEEGRHFLKVFFDKVPQHPWYVLMQLCIDPVMMVVAVILTGGRTSPFHFLMLLPVAFAGIVYGRSTALTMGLISSAVYGCALIGFDKVVTFDIAAIVHSPILINVLGLVSGCCLIAVLTNVLKYKFHTMSQLAEDRLQEVQAMKLEVDKLKVRETKLSYQESLAKVLSSAWGLSEPKTSFSTSMPLGQSESIKRVRELIAKVSPTDATVLVLGESGTGKERVAKAIHENSERSSMPFVAVNCGAIPENLIESELFGHKKGAFTGADRDTAGLFRAAEGGTIFLDEIGELPLSMQAKLLRVLQERTVRPVGADKDIAIDVRVIAATNKDLLQQVARKEFRDDLYYRLNVIEVSLPPLRERLEDLPTLIDIFIKRFTVAGNVPPIISPSALQCLIDYPYPGNIRELENIIERAVVLGGEGIVPEHLPKGVRNFKSDVITSSQKQSTTVIQLAEVELPAKLEDILENIERAYLEAALKESGGVKKKAAEMLGINFRSIRYRLSKFGLEDENSL